MEIIKERIPKISEDGRFKIFKKNIPPIKLIYAFRYRKSYYPYEFSKKSNFIVIDKNDDCYALGKNNFGCLGTKDDMNKLIDKPTQIYNLSGQKIKKFYNGSYHMIASTEDDKIYCWGSNYYGQLGLNKKVNGEFEPEENKKLSKNMKIVDVKCGDLHSLALTKDGIVYAWGDNKFGQIGKKTLEGRDYEPEPLELNELFKNKKVTAIACGGMHSMALCENGTVYSWGYNKFGQCGVKNLPNNDKTAIKKIEIPKLVDLEGIKRICCGRKSSYMVSNINNGNVLYSCGQSYLESVNLYSPEKYTNSPFNHFEELNTIISGELISFKDEESNIWYFGSNEYKINLKYLKIKKIIIKKPELCPFKNFHRFYDEYYKVTYGTLKLDDINDDIESVENDQSHVNNSAATHVTININVQNNPKVTQQESTTQSNIEQVVPSGAKLVTEDEDSNEITISQHNEQSNNLQEDSEEHQHLKELIENRGFVELKLGESNCKEQNSG